MGPCQTSKRPCTALPGKSWRGVGSDPEDGYDDNSQLPRPSTYPADRGLGMCDNFIQQKSRNGFLQFFYSAALFAIKNRLGLRPLYQSRKMVDIISDKGILAFVGESPYGPPRHFCCLCSHHLLTNFSFNNLFSGCPVYRHDYFFYYFDFRIIDRYSFLLCRCSGRFS